MGLSASGEYLATGTGNTFSTCDSFLRVWDWNAEQLLGEIRVDSEKDGSLLFSPDSKMLIIEQEKIEFWGLPSISLLHEIDASGDVVWCDRDNKRIGASSSGTYIYDLESKRNVMKFAAWTRFSPECRFAVSWETNPGNDTLTCYFLDWDLTC
ncbi:MAG: hypothetical protein WCG52_11175 [bacterium]